MKLYQQIQDSDTAEVRLLVPCGVKDEKGDEIGISHVVEHMNLAFVKKEKCEEIISGCTTYEYTEYSVICKNHLDKVQKALKLAIDILMGKYLNESDLLHVKDDILCEVEQQSENPYFYVRNKLLANALPQNICNILPVGRKEDIENLSFEKIHRYFRKNYTQAKSAIFLSSSYDFSKVLINEGESNIIENRPYVLPKYKLKWSASQLYIENHKKIYSIYFTRNSFFGSMEEYILNELEMTYFLIEFDKLFQEVIGKSVNATVYENRIDRNITIYTYEIQSEEVEFVNSDNLKQVIQKVLNEMYAALEENVIDYESVCKFTLNKFQNTSFFQKCRMDYLYGINFEFLTEKLIEKQCKKMKLRNVREILEECSMI